MDDDTPVHDNAPVHDDTPVDDDALLAEQLAYYRAGAGEYDRPYAAYPQLRRLLTVVDELPVTGHVLELACGTGQWTPLLAERARSVTAVDAAPEALALARTRTTASTVRFVEADLFDWRPPRRYDTVFFAFWLSHVPPRRFPAFWDSVAGALAPGGRAIFVDDGPEAAAYEDVLAGHPVPAAVRHLDDGSRHRVVKVFHDTRTLATDLTTLGWSARIRTMAGHYVGVATPQGAGAPAPRPLPR